MRLSRRRAREKRGWASQWSRMRSETSRTAAPRQPRTPGLIEESIGKSNEGSRKLDLVAKSIQQITRSSNQMKTLVDEVDVGSQEQSRGIEQITMAVGQMEKVTQRNAANAEESAAASEELASQARSLYETVERLRRIAGGDEWARREGSARGSQSASPKWLRSGRAPNLHCGRLRQRRV